MTGEINTIPKMQRIEDFSPGMPIIIREGWNSRVWTARPVRVVEDTPELIALYMAPGTIYKHPRTLEGDQVPRLLLAEDWRLVDVKWYGGGALYLAIPGERYMVVGFRNDANSRFVRWYINLQDPLKRTTLGFDYLDMELDVEIDAALSRWQWKDMDKLEELVATGKIAEQKAEGLKELGRDVADRIVGGQSFITRWSSWDPPLEWSVPSLPEGWDKLEV
ncbi:MAG: DUF402 domain-containing protein [Chloroflexota bacterium]